MLPPRHAIAPLYEGVASELPATGHASRHTAGTQGGHAVALTGVEGGFSPVNFQLVMDRPERVRRVMPPTTTSTKTQAEQVPSHTASWRRCPGVRPAVSAAGP